MSEAKESPADIGHRIVSGDIALLRERLLHEPPPLPLTPRRGDFDLNPQNRPKEKRELTPAAVLIPLVFRMRQPHVLLTQRDKTGSESRPVGSYSQSHRRSPYAEMCQELARESFARCSQHYFVVPTSDMLPNTSTIDYC